MGESSWPPEDSQTANVADEYMFGAVPLVVQWWNRRDNALSIFPTATGATPGRMRELRRQA